MQFPVKFASQNLPLAIAGDSFHQIEIPNTVFSVGILKQQSSQIAMQSVNFSHPNNLFKRSQ